MSVVEKLESPTDIPKLMWQIVQQTYSKSANLQFSALYNQKKCIDKNKVSHMRRQLKMLCKDTGIDGSETNLVRVRSRLS